MLTMTSWKPVLSLSKEGAQRSMQTPSSRKRGWAFCKAFGFFRQGRFYPYALPCGTRPRSTACLIIPRLSN